MKLLEKELIVVSEASTVVPASLGAIVGALVVAMIWGASK